MTSFTAAASASASAPALTVLFDGAGPLCRREVAVYRKLVPLQPVRWLDLSDPQGALPAGLPAKVLPCDRATYLARFHVQRADGRWLSGAAAFVALWRLLPGWRRLGRLGALPGATAVLERADRGFLRLRPAMQRAAAAFEAPAVPAGLVPDLRSDHAGETGAVWIYHGVLAVARDRGVRAFASRHRETERLHLARIAAVLPWPRRSRLLLPWRLAGFATGALPALFGPRAVYATVAAVETFVDRHYQHQIDQLDAMPASSDRDVLRALLAECQADECAHRDEAQAEGRAVLGKPGALLRGWCALVGAGSAAAVAIARRL